MLNPVTPIVAGPVAAVAAEGLQDETGTAFAQALDQAEAQQREAGHTEVAEAGRADGRRMPAQADALQRLAGAPPDGVPGDAVAADMDAAPQARVPAEGDDDEGEALPAQATPQDLSAWVSALPLPRAPTAHAAAPAGEAAADAAAPRALRKAEPTGAPPAVGEAPATAHLQGRDRAATAPPRADTRVLVLPEPNHGRGPASADTTPEPARPVAAAPDAAIAPAAGAGVGAPPMGMLAGVPAGDPARSAEPATPLLTELRAAVGSDEFAPALGARLSVLVRDGIEHAQLKLNPAELGPIEVRIDLDGARAQVDFSAAHATTRQALQDAVPALASALRESGLTLTGGGVFEQPREQRGDASAREARRASAAPHRAIDDALPAALAPRPTRSRGVLDLYA